MSTGMLAEHPELASERRLFERELGLVGRRGWTSSIHEIEEDTWTASAAIRDGREVVAALTMPCPQHRTGDRAREHVLRQVIGTTPRSARRSARWRSPRRPGTAPRRPASGPALCAGRVPV